MGETRVTVIGAVERDPGGASTPGHFLLNVARMNVDASGSSSTLSGSTSLGIENVWRASAIRTVCDVRMIRGGIGAPPARPSACAPAEDTRTSTGIR